MVAKDTGFFERQGPDVRLFLSRKPRTMQTLIAGESQIVEASSNVAQRQGGWVVRGHRRRLC
jgi:hypothetical protein